MVCTMSSIFNNLHSPMILSDALQARANRVVLEKTSMVLLRACCAPSVILSASSRIMTLCLPLGRVTFWWANDLIWFLTTSIPLCGGYRQCSLETRKTASDGPGLLLEIPATSYLCQLSQAGLNLKQTSTFVTGGTHGTCVGTSPECNTDRSTCTEGEKPIQLQHSAEQLLSEQVRQSNSMV